MYLMLIEKIKLLDRMSKTKTLELKSVKQSLQKKEREIEELKSKLKEKEGKMNTEVMM